MKIGVEREDLELVLNRSLYDINADKDKMDRLIDNMQKRGYKIGTVQHVVSGNVVLESLPLIDLFVLAYETNRVLHRRSLSPDNFFTDSEIEQIVDYKEQPNEQTLQYPLVFEDVSVVEDGQYWILVLDIQTINKLYNAKLIKYNYKTQRNPKLLKHRDSIVRTPNINYDSVNDIAEKIIKKRYTPPTMTFNLLKDGTDNITYDKQKRTLVIHDGELNIIDGFHNSLAIMAVLLEVDMELNYPVRILNYDEARAGEFVKQVDMQNKISDDHLASIDMSELANVVVRNLNEDTESDMRGMIATDRAMIRNNMALTMYTTMSNTIESLWDLKTRKDAEDLSKYLIDFFNELIGIRTEEFKTDIAKYKRNSYVNYESMFIFYLILAKELQSKANWKDLLYVTIAETNFNKSNEFWDNIGLATTSADKLKRYSKNIQKELIQYIKGVVENV